MAKCNVGLDALISGVVADIHKARRRADLNAVETARLYEDDSDLSALEPPRFGIAEVSIDIRFAVTQVVSGNDEAAGLCVAVTQEELAELDSAQISNLSLRLVPWEGRGKPAVTAVAQTD